MKQTADLLCANESNGVYKLRKIMFMVLTNEVKISLPYSLLLLFQGFSRLAGIHDFWFLQFQPELLKKPKISLLLIQHVPRNIV